MRTSVKSIENPKILYTCAKRWSFQIDACLVILLNVRGDSILLIHSPALSINLIQRNTKEFFSKYTLKHYVCDSQNTWNICASALFALQSQTHTDLYIQLRALSYVCSYICRNKLLVWACGVLKEWGRFIMQTRISASFSSV